MARRVSVLFDVWRGRAEWKSDHRAHAYATAPQQFRAKRDPGGIDAHGGEVKLRRLATQLLDLAGRGIGLEQRVIDQRRDFAVTATVGVQPQPRGTGRHDAADLIRATGEGKTMAGAARGCDRTGCRQFLKNDVDDAFDIGQRTRRRQF